MQQQQMNPINIPKMNNNCLIIDRSINFNIFDKKIKKVPKVKQQDLEAEFRDELEKIKEKNKKKQIERLKYYEEMHKKQDEEREIRILKEQEKLKKLDEKHLQEMKQIDEYYQNQNILLNQKMQLENQ